MRKTLRDIALIIGARVTGKPETVIEGLAGIDDAGPGDLTFLSDPRLVDRLERLEAAAVLISESIDVEPSIPHLRVKDANLAMTTLAERVVAELNRPRVGKHPTAVVGRAGTLGKNVSIGPYVIIEDEAAIGDNSVLHARCTIGREARIGKNCTLYPGVVIGDRCVIGDEVILHPGVVIGADGFGYVQEQGRHRKIPQVGIVEIGDHVEIGANSTVDRARLGKTVIGRGTKIDNLCHVAHSVKIGHNCILAGLVGIAGSAQIGDNVVLAGQVGVADHIKIGSDSQVASKAAVMQDVPPGTVVSGIPAHDHAANRKEWAAVRRLPDLLQRIRELEKKVESGL